MHDAKPNILCRWDWFWAPVIDNDAFRSNVIMDLGQQLSLLVTLLNTRRLLPQYLEHDAAAVRQTFRRWPGPPSSGSWRSGLNVFQNYPIMFIQGAQHRSTLLEVILRTVVVARLLCLLQ